MKLSKLKNDFVRTVYFAGVRKRALRVLKPVVPTTPAFIFGAQRSGTNMLTGILQLHPATEVYDERPDGEIYDRYRIRDFDTLRKVLRKSRASLTCFKAICDSHIVGQFADEFPNARLLWITRHYADVANSRLRKFATATRPIRIVCTGAEGGGWFQEGVSAETAGILRDIYSDQLSEFDLSCLAWWARNRIVVEHELYNLSNLLFLQYEDVVTDPAAATKRICDFLRLPYLAATHRHLFQTSIRKNDYPNLDPEVKRLCDSLLEDIHSHGQPSEVVV
jgi:hypothetical protein